MKDEINRKNIPLNKIFIYILGSIIAVGLVYICINLLDQDSYATTEIIEEEEVIENEEEVIEEVVVTKEEPVIIYEPVNAVKEEIVKYEPIVIKEPTSFDTVTNDYLLTKEDNIITLEGTVKYTTTQSELIQEQLGGNYNNVVQVKVKLDEKYSYSDIKDSLVITIKNGSDSYNNYGVEVLSSTEEEIESNNLYFYWIQAVGKDTVEVPELSITYDGVTSENYVLDLSKLHFIEEVEESNKLMIIPTNKTVIAKEEITYAMIMLEDNDYYETYDVELPSNEEENEEPEETKETEESLEPDTEEPEVKKYIVRITGTLLRYDGDEELLTNLGLEESEYLLATRVLLPDISVEPTLEEPNPIEPDPLEVFENIEVSVDLITGEDETNEYSGIEILDDNLDTEEADDKDGFYFYYGFTEETINKIKNGEIDAPTMSVDFDGEGTNYGDLVFEFDLSEVNLEPKEIEEQEEIE